jgi:hypothetical protein
MNHDEEVSVREYLERLLEERDRRYEERFQAQEKATAVAEDVKERNHRNTLWLAGLTIIVITDIILHYLK